MLPAQLRQEPGDNVHHGGRGVPTAGQLQKQAFLQVPGSHTGRVQTLDGPQRLGNQGIRDVHLQETIQVLLGQIAVLVHQLGDVFGQGQQGLGQMLPVQLITQEGGETLRLPVHGPPLRQTVFLVGKGGAIDTAVDPAGLLPQFLIGAAEGGVVLLLQQGVFLRGAAQIFQQLLGIHLQDFHGLQQLRRQLQFLPQFCFQ